MPTVALDARVTRQMSVGMKAYVRELVARVPGIALDLRFILYGNEPFNELAPNATFHRLPAGLASNGGLGEQFSLPGLFERSGADLVHHMSIYAPARARYPHIYTIHDLIHLRFPTYFSWKIPPYYRFVVGPVARSARCVITDAQATVADLLSYLKVPRDRTRVVPLGVAEAFSLDEPMRAARAQEAAQRLQLARPYFIYSGNHRPHKNIETLVEAWRMMAMPSDLVLTEDGPFGFSLDAQPPHGGRIRAVGHVSQAELIDLYAGCAAAVQPSLYEGFGLGALEAMSAGAPTIVAGTPALLELTSGAALTFVPQDAAELARHLETVLSDPGVSEALRARGRARAREFSWNNTARATVQIYREVLAC